MPNLELDDGVQLFSVMTAACYLLPTESNEQLNAEWLMCSMKRLTPLLQALFGDKATKPGPHIKVELRNLLKELDDQLTKGRFLFGV